MTGEWRWEYDPDHDHVVGGIPAHVVAEVERLTGQLVDLASTGVDISDLGNGPRPGGLPTDGCSRRMVLLPGCSTEPLIIVVRSIPPFDAL
ncbi:hypothetical protein [Streptomyces tendae]